MNQKTQSFRSAREAFWISKGAPTDIAKQQARFELREAILNAKAAGASFIQIGKALGVTGGVGAGLLRTPGTFTTLRAARYCA